MATTCVLQLELGFITLINKPFKLHRLNLVWTQATSYAAYQYVRFGSRNDYKHGNGEKPKVVPPINWAYQEFVDILVEIKDREVPLNCTPCNWQFYRCHPGGGGGAAVAQWLRRCATNRKVAGSTPDGVIGIFHWHNPSDRTMALGSSQPLTEMSTRRISWG